MLFLNKRSNLFSIIFVENSKYFQILNIKLQTFRIDYKALIETAL